MAIDPRNERNVRYGFEKKLHDITGDYCKEKLTTKASTNIEYDVPTNYGSNEIYIIPNDVSLDPEYTGMEYSKGTLLIQCISLIDGMDGPSIFCLFKFSNLFHFMNCFSVYFFEFWYFYL